MNMNHALRTAAFAAIVAVAAPALALAQGAANGTAGQSTAGGMGTTSPGTSSSGSSAMATGGGHAQMSQSQIENVLKAQGYSNIKNFKQNGSHDTADAMRYGKQVNNLKIDASTGEVTNQQELSESQVKDLLKQRGYSDVDDVKKNGDHFTANAKQDGNKKNLRIDAQTGTVMPQQG